MKPLKKNTPAQPARADDDLPPPGGRAMASDPLAEDAILEHFYRPTATATATASASLRADENKKQKPTHYKIVCISLYNEDIERLGELVKELKRRGHTKANKSQVIRAALDQIDLGKIPKGY